MSGLNLPPIQHSLEFNARENERRIIAEALRDWVAGEGQAYVPGVRQCVLFLAAEIHPDKETT